jgi:hypothetical protein
VFSKVVVDYVFSSGASTVSSLLRNLTTRCKTQLLSVSFLIPSIFVFQQLQNPNAVAPGQLQPVGLFDDFLSGSQSCLNHKTRQIDVFRLRTVGLIRISEVRGHFPEMARHNFARRFSRQRNWRLLRKRESVSRRWNAGLRFPFRRGDKVTQKDFVSRPSKANGNGNQVLENRQYSPIRLRLGSAVLKPLPRRVPFCDSWHESCFTLLQAVDPTGSAASLTSLLTLLAAQVLRTF